MFENFTRRHHLDKPKYVLKHQYIPSAFRFDVYKVVLEDCETTISEYCLYRDTAIGVNKESFRAFLRDEIDRGIFLDRLKVIVKYIKEGELEKDTVWAKFAYTASDGKNYQVDHLLRII